MLERSRSRWRLEGKEALVVFGGKLNEKSATAGAALSSPAAHDDDDDGDDDGTVNIADVDDDDDDGTDVGEDVGDIGERGNCWKFIG